MPKAADPLADYIVDQLRDWAPVTARRLFGGWGVYNGRVMFGLIARDAIYFRVDDINRPDYAAAGTRPFRYTMPNGKVNEMAYSEVPANVLEDDEELARWATKAHTAALKVARVTSARSAKPKPIKPRVKARLTTARRIKVPKERKAIGRS